MNYPFEIKEDVALEGFAKKPVMKIGMTLERMCYVKVSDINISYANFGREEGKTDGNTVKELRVEIREGRYEGQFHEPPVITPDGKLVAGKHRFKAFIAERIEYIWVAIVKFSNTKVLRQYAICENLTRNPKNVADISDVVSNVISAIAAGDCNKNKSSINTYLKEIGWSLQIGKTVDAVMSAVVKDYKQMDNVTRDELIAAVDDEYGIDINAATQWVVATLRGGGSVESTDRYSRLWKNIYPLLVEGLDVNVAVGLTNTLAKDIADVRKNINNNFLSNNVDMCLEVADAYKSGKLGTINFLFKTQVDGEVGNFIDEIEE
jgi:tRNA threonylcarbamoyladenosine modification (KEOPS) complex  Pcc1 subunit